MTNVLTAIRAIINHPISDLVNYYQSKNRINQMGEALECFIKDIFADTVTESDQQKKLLRYSEVFSYSGNANNPPDLILRRGDAVEVKKIESIGAGIALNSSYPKSKLYADSPLITSHCRNCEDWQEKDIIYAIGVAQGKKLKLLWLIYGDCYFADRKIYENAMNIADPLEVTKFGNLQKCNIASPEEIFSYLSDFKYNSNFSLHCIIKKEKYYSFPRLDIKSLERFKLLKNFKIMDIDIKSPNNPGDLLPARLISFWND